MTASGAADNNAASAAVRGARNSLPAGSFRLQNAQILDQHGFGRVMTAMTMLIPAGWRASGGVVWQSNPALCGKNATHVEWRAVAADGLSAIELLPQESWSGNNLQLPAMPQGCPNVTISNVKDYLHWYAGRVRPGARILEYRDRPDMTTSLGAYNRSDRGVAGELKSWVQGGELLLASQVDGRDMRESLAIVVVFMLNRMSGVMPGEIREFVTISAMAALAVRAPQEQFDLKFAEMIRRSMKVDPQWSTAMAAHNQKMMGIAAKGAADRHEIRMQTAREVAEINRQGDENRQASRDRGHSEFVRMIREVEIYVDPKSKESIELPSTHDRIWRLEDGTYLFTNDAALQPGRDLGVEGRQLEVGKK